MEPQKPDANDALSRARKKAYVRLIPLLFLSYVVAYIDRVNIAFAKLTSPRICRRSIRRSSPWARGCFSSATSCSKSRPR